MNATSACLLLLLSAGSLAAADEPSGCDRHRSPERFDRARRLQADGKLVAAAQAFRAIVEQDRFDLPCAGPALVQWAACCQGRASDPALATEWEQQAPRLLEGGVGSGPVDARLARESLLWKSWSDQPAIVPVPKGAVMSSRPGGKEVQPCWLAFVGLAQGKGYALPARSDAISEILPAQATQEGDGAALVSDPWFLGIVEPRSWIGSLPFPVSKQAVADRILRVSGTLRITQATDGDVVVLPLKAQATAELPGAGGITILALKSGDRCGGFHVLCSRPKGGADPNRLRERIAEVHRRGLWMPDALIQEQWDEPGNLESYWLLDGQGRRIHPAQIEGRVGRGKQEELLLCFQSAIQPSAMSLVVCHRKTPSSREFPFSFTREELKAARR